MPSTLRLTLPALALSSALVLPLVGTPCLAAEVPPDEEALHEELRTLREGVLEAWEARDLDRLLAYVDENVVVTWQNAEVNRGHDGVRRFYQEVMGGESPLLSNITSELSVDELSILHGGDTAIAFGSMKDTMSFGQTLERVPLVQKGIDISLTSRWTATLVRKDDGWKLASYHTSADLFNNPVLSLASERLFQLATIATVVGAAVGALIVFLLMRRRRRVAAGG